MRNIKIVLEYDGAGYFGWQRQNGQRSIQETLEEKIQVITKEKVTVIGSGRTDTGVHALNQVANFRMMNGIREEELLYALNSVLPDDIVIKELVETDPSFHARFDAKAKKYLYRIWNGRTDTALRRHYCWYVRKVLDIAPMLQASGHLTGTHDFKAFCGTGSKVKDYVRTVHHIGIEKEDPEMILITITADGFLRHMVRNIVGTLVDAGKNRLSPGDVKAILASRDRKKAGMTAPVRGLFLVEVHY